MKIVAINPIVVNGTNRDGDPVAVGQVRDAGENPWEHRDPMGNARHGIHVCADEASFDWVREAYGHWDDTQFAKVKVECTGFLAGGIPGFHGKDASEPDSTIQNETWQQVKILEITPL